jgi:hypothetical protein
VFGRSRFGWARFGWARFERTRFASWALLAAVVGSLCVALPGGALAASSQSNPLIPSGSGPLSSGLPQASTTTPTTTTPQVVSTTSTGSGSAGLSGTDAVIIGIAALVIIALISLFIWRDARKRAPVRHRATALAEVGGRSGSKARGKPRKLSPAEKRRRKRGRAR